MRLALRNLWAMRRRRKDFLNSSRRSTLKTVSELTLGCHFLRRCLQQYRLHVTFVFSVFTEEHSLTCYRCYSTTSWEDCDKKMRAENCPTGYDEVCTKIKRTEWVDIKNSSQQEKKVHYFRGCDLAKACSGKECREKDWDCTVACCSTDLCNSNTSVNMLASFILTAALPWIALEALFAF